MVSGGFRGVVDFEFFGVIKSGKSGALLLFESGDVGELAHVVEHDTEVVVKGGQVLNGFIFIFLLFLQFLLVFGLDSEVILLGEGIVV
jgi:hypothetical protein